MKYRFRTGQAKVIWLFLLFCFFNLAESSNYLPGPDILQPCGQNKRCKIGLLCETNEKEPQKPGRCKRRPGSICELVDGKSDCHKDTICQEERCRMKVGLRCVNYTTVRHGAEIYETYPCEEGSFCERDYCRLMNGSQCGGDRVAECGHLLVCLSLDDSGGDCECVFRAERGLKKPCNIPKSGFCGNGAQGQCGEGLACRRAGKEACRCQTEGQLCPIPAQGVCDEDLQNQCDSNTKQVCGTSSENESLICLGSQDAMCLESSQCLVELNCELSPDKEEGYCSGFAVLMQGIATSFLLLLMSLIARCLTFTFL